jgi:hypothetical protein
VKACKPLWTFGECDRPSNCFDAPSSCTTSRMTYSRLSQIAHDIMQPRTLLSVELNLMFCRHNCVCMHEIGGHEFGGAVFLSRGARNEVASDTS